MEGYYTTSRKTDLKGGLSKGVRSEVLVRNSIPITGVVTDFQVAETTYSYRNNTQSEPPLLTAREVLARFDNRFLLDKYDTGHEFWTEKKWTNYSHSDQLLYDPLKPTQTRVRGALVPNAVLAWPTMPSFDSNTYGNRAISKLAPTVPQADLLQSTTELIREGVSLPFRTFDVWGKKKAEHFRDLGSDYLNLSFGWVPFISDILKVVASVSNINKHLLEMKQNSGLIVRRRLSFPPINKVSKSNGYDTGLNIGDNSSNIDSWYELYPGVGKATGSTQFTERSSERIWFTGAFTYYLNPGENLLGKIERYEQFANKLLGTRMTPALLWELSPWSWLADWFVDIGPALKTASLFQSDGLVMKYGYLMRTTALQRSVSLSGIEFKLGSPGVVSRTRHLLRKERLRGTPFGFGSNPNAFSERQWAILAALGLSKAPKTLF